MTEIQQQLATRVASLTAPTPLTAGISLNKHEQSRVTDALHAVRANGFAIVRDFLTPAALAELRLKLEPIFQQTTSRELDTTGRIRAGYSGLQTVHVHNLFAKTCAIDHIAIDPTLLMIIEGVLGPLFQMSVATAMCPDPGVDPQGLHQDDGHYPLARPHPPFIANTLIALDDFSEENGCTRLVPGSHLRTEGVDQQAEVVHAEMPAGSLLIFDGALWHGGGGNRTANQRRRSINLNFNLSWLRQQENQYLGIARERWLEMPVRLQRLLGLQKVNFLYGSVDYQDPLEFFLSHTSESSYK